MRHLQYIITEEEANKSIGTVLKEKAYSRGVVIELKKTEEGIRKNGKWARVNEVLEIGDILDICLQESGNTDNIVPRHCEFDILYEDEDILVVSKPWDTPIHPSINNYDNTLANGIAYFFEKQNVSHVFRCINRLDRDTTGITIIAKHLLSASILSESLKGRDFSRQYLAIVEGETLEEGIIELPIGRAPDSIIKRRVDEVHGKEAKTHYRTIERVCYEGQKLSVVALKLATGRTHQIRVHMAAIGHPLIGDFLYNPNNKMLTRQALHAIRCEFYHPITGEYLKIKAPLPQDMAALLDKTETI